MAISVPRRPLRAAMLALALPCLAGAARAQGTADCTPAWQPTFAPPQGLDDDVHALVVHDDGAGLALFAGGKFTVAGGTPANYVARWDGTSWSPLGSGMGGTATQTQLWVNALTVFDDGSGPALYAGGSFVQAGGGDASRIARWDGANWSAVGSGPFGDGVSGGTAPQVLSLVTFDDGSGPALYVAGTFNKLGSSALAPPVGNIAKWDGTQWSPLGDGISIADASTQVFCLTVFDDGSGGGPALYAAGRFLFAGGVPANGIARWDGEAWSALVSGPHSCVIRAMAVFDDGGGDGPGLYACGAFAAIGGELASSIARWNGTAWSPLGSGLLATFISGDGRALATFDDGSGPALYVGGDFGLAGGLHCNRIARWDGVEWSPLGAGMVGGQSFTGVMALATFDSGAGPELHVGGDFATADGVPSGNVAAWGGCPAEPSAWTNLGWALPGTDGPPLLAGSGTPSAGLAVQLLLTHARPSAPAVLFTGLSGNPTFFKGGKLVPVPVLLSLALTTGAGGSIALPFVWPPGVPPGFALFYQYGIQDAAAPHGAALSNALQSMTP